MPLQAKARAKRLALSVAASPLFDAYQRAAVLRRLGHTGIDADCLIEHGCQFRGYAVEIGAGSFINYGVYFDDNCPITLGKKVSVGPRTMFVTATHVLGPAEHRIAGEGVADAPITVGDGTWIGANATVLPGVTIGSGCVIAAGAVVAKGCASNGLYAGVPARRIKDLPV